MQLKNHAFQNLPFSDLFKTYINEFNRVAEFYETDPFNSKALKKYSHSLRFTGNRSQSAALLKQFNEQFPVEDATFENIKRIRQENSLAIVTGQQLGLYGGPVFTMFKTVTALHLAGHLEEVLARPVIPVFWLADEDHDYEEVRHMQVLNEEGLESFSLPSKENGLPPVSEIQIPAEIEGLQSRLRSTLLETDFSDTLWKLLDNSFTPGKTFSNGFGDLVARLFSRHGLVLAGSNHTAIKQHLKAPIVTAIEKADKIRKALENQSESLESRFHRQATVYDSHLFYLQPEKGRIKIERTENGWQTEAGHQWTRDELASEVESTPEKFSPDVFLRPVLQDKLLPTFGYAAGPGEVAYYGQMKSFYRCFDQKMPVIFPRLSGTFVEPAIDRILQKLPFELSEYNQRIEDLESAFVDRTEQIDIEALFEEWKQEAAAKSSSFITKIVSVDDTLEGAAEKALSAYFNELDKLKGKVYRAVKKRENIQLNRIHRIQQNLFPERNLQERSLSGIYYMNKFGLDIWDRLLDKMEGLEPLDTHQLIYI